MTISTEGFSSAPPPLPQGRSFLSLLRGWNRWGSEKVSMEHRIVRCESDRDLGRVVGMGDPGRWNGSSAAADDRRIEESDVSCIDGTSRWERDGSQLRSGKVSPSFLFLIVRTIRYRFSRSSSKDKTRVASKVDQKNDVWGCRALLHSRSLRSFFD